MMHSRRHLRDLVSPRLFVTPVQGSETDERYTPLWLFHEMGLTFDLDVAAPPGGVPWIPAARCYSVLEDGLASRWAGSVWMNPPYSNPEPWVDRFLEHGDGVCLVPISVNASWVYRLLRAVPAIAFLEHVRFVHPTHTGRHVPVAVMLTALGERCADAPYTVAASGRAVLLRPS